MNILLALISGFILSFCQVLLKLFINLIGDFKVSSLLHLKPLILGISIGILGILGFWIWYYVLTKTELSNIYWTTSIFYIAVPVLSIIILNENLSKANIMGYMIITFGAILSSL